MGISLSQGPWTYNRFDLYEKKAKPDFLDMDKDGNKKESMKKAIKDKGGCDDCGKKDCNCDKKDVKEGYGGKTKSYVPGAKVGVKVKKGPGLSEEVIQFLIDEGIANNTVSAEIIATHMSEDYLEELWKGKHGQSDKEYMDGRSDAGKQISGDSKQSGAAYSHRAFKGAGSPAKPGERQKHQGKMTNADRNELAIRKNALKNK